MRWRADFRAGMTRGWGSFGRRTSWALDRCRPHLSRNCDIRLRRASEEDAYGVVCRIHATGGLLGCGNFHLRDGWVRCSRSCRSWLLRRFSNPAREFLLTKGAERFRESVLATRSNLDPNAPENLEIITTATTQPHYVYDARARRASTIDQYVADEGGGRKRRSLVREQRLSNGPQNRLSGNTRNVGGFHLFESVAYFTGICLTDPSFAIVRGDSSPRTLLAHRGVASCLPRDDSVTA